MVKRTETEWRGLFEEQARSGMAQRRFCSARGLCPKYFSLRKKQLGWASDVPGPSPFVRIQKALPVEIPSTPRAVWCAWGVANGNSGTFLSTDSRV